MRGRPTGFKQRLYIIQPNAFPMKNGTQGPEEATEQKASDPLVYCNAGQRSRWMKERIGSYLSSLIYSIIKQNSAVGSTHSTQRSSSPAAVFTGRFTE